MFGKKDSISWIPLPVDEIVAEEVRKRQQSKVVGWDKPILPGSTADSKATTVMDTKIHYGALYVPALVCRDSGEPVPAAPILEYQNGYEKETTLLTRGMMIRLSGSEELKNCDDFCGVRINQAGEVKIFVVADGVSEGLASGSVAKSSVTHMLHTADCLHHDTDAREQLVQAIQGVERTVKQSVDKDSLEKEIKARHSGQQGALLLKVQLERLYQDKYGSTTLLTGFVDQNTLHTALVGDGGYVVANKNGLVGRGGSDAVGAPPQISVDAKRILDPDKIQYHETRLTAGDLVVVFSDGVIKGKKKDGSPRQLDIVANWIVDMIKSGKSIQEISQQLLEGVEGQDDVTLIIFEHR